MCVCVIDSAALEACLYKELFRSSHFILNEPSLVNLEDGFTCKQAPCVRGLP